jgi:hypothetical protein
MPDTMQDAHASKADATQPRHWLAAYTRSRHEQQVVQQLQQKNFACLLPTYNKMRRFEIPHGTGRPVPELTAAAD